MLPIIYIAMFLIMESTIPIRCEDPPLRSIYDVVQHFPKVHACNRVFTTGFRISRRGVREVTFTGTYRRSETAETLSRCILGYENQKDWLSGSTNTCTPGKEPNTATLTIRGTPDANVKQHTPDNNFLLLHSIDDLNCLPLRNDCYDFKLECDLLPKSLDKQKVCDVALNYINQDNWWCKLSSPCDLVGNVVKLDISSDKEPANCRGRNWRD